MYLFDTNALKLFVGGDANTVRRVERLFQSFPASIKRIGPQDCRIAAQAIAHGLIVVTRNLRDFNAIGAPGEDWST